MSQYNHKKQKVSDYSYTPNPWQDEPDLESESEGEDMEIDVEELVERFEGCLSQLEKLIQGLKLNTTCTP